MFRRWTSIASGSRPRNEGSTSGWQATIARRVIGRYSLPARLIRPAEQGVEERALARPRAPQEADHERPVEVDLGDAEPGLEPGDEALGRGERGPGGRRAGPVDQPRVEPVEARPAGARVPSRGR